MNKKLVFYSLPNGIEPVRVWLENAIDVNSRSRIKARLDRVLMGNYGDYKFLGNSIYEFRINFGSGYRIYFAKIDKDSILLLCAGDKSSQSRDIEKAQKYLKQFLV
jgi:putative addiction module killer protein